MIGEQTNHLWQSTVFAMTAGLLSLAFRKNRAQVRYWLWFSASVKFLIPFSLLLSLGSYLGQSRPLTSGLNVPAITYTVIQVAEPFPQSPPPPPSTPSHGDWIPITFVGFWACGFAVIGLIRLRAWLRIRAAVRSSLPMDIPFPVQVRASPGLLEPGVVGFFRPMLLLPTGIVERLTPSQLQAVLAHELCHIRRRDNLTAAIHMIVEAVFWFHPLVWWISARLMAERERACDEGVLELGSEPRVYAESILKTCEFCVESPLTCVSGVTGADLKKRIVRIMTEHVASKLSFGRMVLLAAFGVAVLAGPVGFGLVNSPQIRPQSTDTTVGPLPSFEVASIKRSRSGEKMEFDFLPNRLIVRNCFIDMLIECAYGHDLGEFGFIFLRHDQLVGDPGWIQPGKFGYEGYDIDAKVDDSLAEKFGKDCGRAFDRGRCGYRKQMILMLQSLLADRFKLKVRRDTKEGSVYALVVAKGGPKFLHTIFEVPDYAAIPQNSTLPPPHRPPCPEGMVCAQLNASMAQVALLLSRQPEIGRPVIDQTGIQGSYYIKLQYAREQPESGSSGTSIAPPLGPGGPSIFTALPEQLGLKLESTKGPVDVIVIDHIERPSEN